MALLGAIVAGGMATRFGADKGAALLNGTALIDHVANGLSRAVDAVVVVGRDWPGLTMVADHPRLGLGPLGGLCGALRYAAANKYDVVAMTPCDLLPVPDFRTFGAGPAIIEGHEICGVWPSHLLNSLGKFIETAPKLSMKAWSAESGAEVVAYGREFFDLNTPKALANFRLNG